MYSAKNTNAQIVSKRIPDLLTRVSAVFGKKKKKLDMDTYELVHCDKKPELKVTTISAWGKV